MARRYSLPLGLACVCAGLTAFASAQAPPKATVWVLEQKTINEYVADTFLPGRIVAVPAHAFDHPEFLSINARGQMLYATTPGLEFGDGAATTVWFFDGKAAPPFARDSVESTPRTWFLSGIGDSLYAFENRFDKTLDKDGNDASVRTTSRLLKQLIGEATLRTDAPLGTLPVCQCTTGVCSESCSEWQAWAPDGAIRDFFLATKYTPGQLQTSYDETRIFTRSGSSWSSSTVPEPIESPLDASSDGRVIVGTSNDAGCCGWINESSDQLLLWRNGKRTVLYDEWVRFDNRNYDASFAVRRADLSPSNTLVAYTIVADAPPPNEEIRLSADGKANAAELARVRKAIADLPVTEIVDLNQPTSRPIAIPKADVVGWISDSELLVVENGKLVTYDARGTKKRQPPIEAKSAAHVFVR